jgi:hypothetical protein
VPTSSAPQYVSVDLGLVTPIDTVRVLSRAGCGPRHVTVGISTNWSTWTTVASADLANAEGPSQFVFPVVNARWIRLTATSSYCATSTSVEELEAMRAVGR